MNLQKQRSNLQQLELNRSSLSKQAALITEAEALGSALSSHPLNTLTQRYNVFKRTRTEYNSCKQALLDQSLNCTKQMVAYRNCLDAVDSNKTTEYLLELKELIPLLQAKPVTHEFDLVKEFLENSAQMAIYLQSCQISSELNVRLMQQNAAVQQTLETLIQYASVIQYHPVCVHLQHRISKYSEWCQYLSEHQSVQDCRDIVTQFQTSIGKNAINKVPLQQVITFSYQLQANIRDGEFKLQKFIERLNGEVDAANGGDISANILQFCHVYEDAQKSIGIYLQGNDHNEDDKILALHCVTTTILCDLNKRLLMMENAAASSGENLVDLTFNSNWFLDEIYAHSSIMCEMTTIIDASSRKENYGAQQLSPTTYDKAVQSLHEIQNIYLHLRLINDQFSSNILPDAMHGIIGEDKSVLDMISTLSSLQEGLQSIPELLTNLHLHLRRSSISISGTATTSFNSTAETTTTQTTADVKELKQKLNDMKMEFENADGNSAGKQLFLSFNGLFEALDEKYQCLVDCMQNISVPNWKKIDQIKNAMDLLVISKKKKEKII